MTSFDDNGIDCIHIDECEAQGQVEVSFVDSGNDFVDAFGGGSGDDDKDDDGATLHNCHSKTTCINRLGSFKCNCNGG